MISLPFKDLSPYLLEFIAQQQEQIAQQQEQIVQLQERDVKLNSRPRKCLGFRTPYEVFEELTGVDVRKLMGYALIT